MEVVKGTFGILKVVCVSYLSKSFKNTVKVNSCQGEQGQDSSK